MKTAKFFLVACVCLVAGWNCCKGMLDGIGIIGQIGFDCPDPFDDDDVMGCGSVKRRAAFCRLLAYDNAMHFVKAVIEGRVDLNTPDENRNTALIDAAYWGDAHAVALLIAKKADIEAHGSYGDTALIKAAGEGHAAVVELLLHARAEVDAKSNDRVWKKRTALMAAAMYGHTDVVGLLLRFGANVNATDENGKTVLMQAVDGCGPFCVEIGDMLLDAGADIDARDGRGETALTKARFWRNAEAVAFLLKAGATESLSELMERCSLM